MSLHPNPKNRRPCLLSTDAFFVVVFPSQSIKSIFFCFKTFFILKLILSWQNQEEGLNKSEKNIVYLSIYRERECKRKKKPEYSFKTVFILLINFL